MAKDLLEYLKKDESKEDDKPPEDKEVSAADMKAEYLAMKYEQTHEPDKRVAALIALVRCIADKD